MNEFERKIREALAATQRNTFTRLPTSEFQTKGTPASGWEASPSSETPLHDTAASREEVREAPLDSHSGEVSGRAALSRPGIITGRWDNPLIAAAMPVLLLVEQVRDQAHPNPAAIRAQLVREIQQFQQVLSKAQTPREDTDKLAYLLCSYVDECCMNRIGANGLELSLLVEFYRDSWGGEQCFEHLQGYLAVEPKNRDILAFYDLILSLGFEGKYHVIERGPVLLADVRSYLNTYLYAHYPTLTLADAAPEKVTHKKRRITPLMLLGCGLLAALVVYGIGAWYLHNQSRELRSAIMAWTLPTPRKINIMETLPEPLPKILSEGWLEVRSDPRGWLLIFTSDGAFANGDARLSEEFKQKRNIERLGEALAPWPGDLEVIGHTDNIQFRQTSHNNNLKLSEARAQTVADILRLTLANSKYNRSIISIGKGDTEPLDNNATEDGRRRNRRVDILWKIGERESASPPADLNGSDVSAVPDRN